MKSQPSGCTGLSAAVLVLFLAATIHLSGAIITVTKATDGGNGSLREAINRANTNADLDTINFNLSGGAGVKTLTFTNALPQITNPLFIDGWSQGGAGYAGPPLIELRGNGLAGWGLHFFSCTSNTVRGLIINSFLSGQLLLNGQGFSTIQGNYIGTDPTGTLARNTNADGIAIERSASNIIGGTNASQRNVISGNRYGIPIHGFANNNAIQGNYIGLNAAGTAAVANELGGVYSVTLDGTTSGWPSNNTIGGSAPGARNIISGNGGPGIGLGASEPGTLVGPTRNLISGNYIGTDVTGLLAVPNFGPGIFLTNATENLIGGSEVGARNVISGNIDDGIMIWNSRSNIVEGNWIGPNATATAPIGNMWGIAIYQSSFNVVGGLIGNVICDSDKDGIQLGNGSYSNQVINNIIGANNNLQVRMPNLRHGVAIFDSTNNIIGGAEDDSNYIIGNRSNGVMIASGDLNTLSLSNIVRGNVIAENQRDGVQLGAGAWANRIVGNQIGAAQAFTGVQLNGNFRHGIGLFDATNNIIGGATPDDRNYISGNASNGVFFGKGFVGSGAVSNALYGNRIGTISTNGGVGVYVEGDWNVIGGTNQGEGNVIFGNGASLKQRGHGVVIASGEHNPILGNLLWGNSGRGIDLGNDSFTVNDLNDVDTGANALQNYPVVTRVAFYPAYGFQDTTWTLNSKTNRAYRIELFYNSAPDPSGFGEGQGFLGAVTVTTDTNGFAEHRIRTSFEKKFFSATATDLQDWNTSEFSPVDTDGDAIADAWETRGIDFDEDGTIDLLLPTADPMNKDIYVEIDAMAGRAPDMNNLDRVNSGTVDEHNFSNNDGFLSAPADKVQNPTGKDGIFVHLELDEINLPLASWQYITDNTTFDPFDVLKSNHFGTVSQQANTNTLNAKRLFYRYCIFADIITNATDGVRFANGATRGLRANDFFIARGTNSSLPLSDEVASTFMHELGHSLGLDHGGFEGTNCKPNYHSLMNYIWSPPLALVYPFLLDYSRDEFPSLNEADLDENIGIGAPQSHFGHKVVVGPSYLGTNVVEIPAISETGPIDWNNNTNFEQHVARDLSFLKGTKASPGDIMRGSEDWSRLRYYFLDQSSARPGFITPFANDLSPTILEEIHKVGTGPGLFQFSAPFYSVSETGLLAVITVTRTFEVDANVSVSFATLPGTATNGLDYLPTNGVLNFIGTETEKSFAIPIINDALPEEPETIRLVLSGPTGGAKLGTISEATLTIIDNDPPGHFTVSNTNNSGVGSLRQAILDANSATGLALIDFNIPATNGLTISPTTALPTITNRLTIDGTTQPGFAGTPILELNGASAGIGSDGLRITAGHCTVRGLVINRFIGSGINLLTGGANHIEGCFIGLNRAGTLDQGNASHGVNVQSGDNIIGGTNLAARNFISGNNIAGIGISGVSATNNQILGNVIGLGVDGSDQGNSSDGVQISTSRNIVGGSTTAARNIISGNDRIGVFVQSGVENTILGNYIGTDLTGTLARGNTGDGITLASRSIFGGNKPGAGNLISGNGGKGIDLEGTNSVVLGNRIGTDSSGTNALPNQTGGIIVSGSNHRIGDTNQFGANIIAFNNGPAVAVPNPGSVNNTIRGNSIFSSGVAGSGLLGIDLGTTGPTPNDAGDGDTGGNQLQNSPFLTSVSNSLAGTLITGFLNSRPNTNYTIDFYANIVPSPSGFGDGQFWIGSATVATETNGNVTFNALSPAIFLRGRYITATATDAAGNTSEFSPAISPDAAVEGSTFTVVNTNDSGEGSLRQAILDANANISQRDTIAFDIAGAGVHTIRPLSQLPTITDPVLIDGYTQPGTSTNTAATGHNGVLLIELDGSVAGATHGLRIEAGNSIVRGLVIDRFATNANPSDLPGGIMLTGGGGNRVEGNFIGTDPTGFLDRGNVFRGVVIYHSSSNVIGGTLSAARNVISGNDVPGGGLISGEAILLYGDNTPQPPSGNRIEGNLLGTAADGITALGNSGSGVRFNQPITNTTIGGISPGAGNVIAFNSGADVLTEASGVDDPLKYGPHGIAVLGNSIYSNNGLGIQGNLVNSPDGRGNFPFLSSAISSNGQTTIQGRLYGVSNATHRIEFFANDTFGPSGNGEGKIFLGGTYVLTDTNGFAAFTNVLPMALSNNMVVTATATDDQNNTSEFSPRLKVGDVLTNVIVVNSINDVDDGVANTNHTSLREAIFAANNHPGPDLIRFAIGTGAKTIGLSNALPALMDAGTTIDGTTQPGFAGPPQIFLDGLFLAPAGFRLYAPSNTIRGFAINDFSYGIYGDAAYSSPFGGFNVIEGNYLGTDGVGAAARQDYGIYFTSSFLPGGFPGNRIGGATAAARNVISGNRRAGVFAFGSASNTFAGNYVGMDRTGTNALGNGASGNPLGGLFLQRCQGTVVGGSALGAGNTISGNASLFQHTQLFLTDDCSGSVVQGNFIGIDATGRTLIDGFVSLSIGGPALIKSNLLCGQVILGSSNRFEGNFIATDVTGTRSFGIAGGLLIDSGNLIGGTNAVSRNLIYGGLTISGQSNVVQGNLIGTQVDGLSPLANLSDGIRVQNSFNLIGGTTPNSANTIAFNGGAGISVSSGTNNALLGNSIFSNTNLGVDLGASGVTTNDFGDLDSGANNLQNFPILSAARNIGSSTLLDGTLNSRSNTLFRLEFFANTNCHPSGFGQGRTFLNSTTITTDSSGNTAFSFTHPVPILAGQFITATATDSNNNTSEFSPCVAVYNDTNYVFLSFTTTAPYVLSWSTNASGFLLERATNLTPPLVWQIISNGIITIGANKTFTVTNDSASPALFFRLRGP